MTSPVIHPTATPPRTILDFLRENWQWVAPLIYVYVTAVGMVQAWLQFQRFHLNIFEFSELNDFLLAAFREPLSFLAVLGLVAYGALGVLATLIFAKLRERRQAPGTGLPALHRTQKWTMWITFVTMVIIAPYFAPRLLHEGYGEEWKAKFLTDRERIVDVQLKDFKDTDDLDGWMRSLLLVGITGKFVFLYVPETKRILIVPVANLIAMTKA